jgi:hypothetical protein
VSCTTEGSAWSRTSRRPESSLNRRAVGGYARRICREAPCHADEPTVALWLDDEPPWGLLPAVTRNCERDSTNAQLRSVRAEF